MAHMHFRRTVYDVSTGGSRKRILYITRDQGMSVSHSARQLAYTQRESREDLVLTETRNLPRWAANGVAFFEAAEKYERANGVAFEEWKVTLPKELSVEANVALTADIIDAVAGDDYPVVYAFHNPQTIDGQGEQPHLHIIISARKTDMFDRGEAGHFRRWNAAQPWKGGAQKGHSLSKMGAVRAHRELVADIINLHLEAHGAQSRVYPGSLASLGIVRKPEPKMLPSESADWREKGVKSGKVLEIEALRAQRDKQAEAERIQIAWEHRKRYLGIDGNMSWEDALLQVRIARDDRITMPPQVESTAKLRVIERAAQREVMRVGRGVKRDRHEVRGGLHLHVFERRWHEK